MDRIKITRKQALWMLEHELFDQPLNLFYPVLMCKHFMGTNDFTGVEPSDLEYLKGTTHRTFEIWAHEK